MFDSTIKNCKVIFLLKKKDGFTAVQFAAEYVESVAAVQLQRSGEFEF